jgi:hypothetical protein
MGINETIHNDVRQAKLECESEKLILNKQSSGEVLLLKTEVQKLQIDVYEVQKKVNFLNDYVSYLLMKENYQKDPTKKEKYLEAERRFQSHINIE